MTRMLKQLTIAGGLAALLLTMSGCKQAADKMKEELAAANNPFPTSSPLHAPVDRMTRRLINDPRFVARSQGLRGEEAQQAGARLGMDGLPRLPHDQLETRAKLMGALLDKMTVSDCAASTRVETPTDALRAGKAVFGALEKLPQDKIDLWFELAYNAMVAELDQAPGSPLTDQQVEETVSAWLASIPDQAQREHSLRVLTNLSGSSDEDVCQLGRGLYHGVSTLPQPYRGQLAWTLTAS